VRTLLHRYVDSLLDAPRAAPVGRARAGYSLWQRYWAALTGITLAPRGPNGPEGRRPALIDRALPHAPATTETRRLMRPRDNSGNSPMESPERLSPPSSQSSAGRAETERLGAGNMPMPGNAGRPKARIPRHLGGRLPRTLAACLSFAAVAGVIAAVTVITVVGGRPAPPSAGISPASSASMSTSATPSPSSGIGSEQAEVTQLTPEIQQAASARKTVLRATGAVGRCTMAPSTAISLMNQAISQRQTAIGRLGSLSVNAIPDGHAMLADLKRLLRRSITADHRFIGWMQDIQATTCPVNTSTDTSYQHGLRASARAVEAKIRFVALWNPIATQFGQPTFTISEI
jgi:hypothetical protein